MVARDGEEIAEAGAHGLLHAGAGGSIGDAKFMIFSLGNNLYYGNFASSIS